MTGVPDSDTRMSDVEALMWRLERNDARFRAVITIVVSLDHSPGIEALRYRADVLSRTLPRFRARVAPPVTALATPRWEQDTEFDLGQHVRAVAVPGAGTLDDVFALAGAAAADGLDPSRPLWRMTLVEGMAAGRAAVVIRLHHTITDGLGALKLATILFDLHPDAPVPGLPAIDDHRPLGIAERAVGDLVHETGKAVGLARWAPPTVATLVREAVTNPERRAASTVRLARSVARAVTPSSRPCSPVMVGRSTGAAFGALQMGLDDARAVARTVGGTVNDVFLSAVLDGLRRYHDLHGSRPDVLRLGVPVSLRAAGDDSLHNQFFPARMLAPLQIDDPLDRLRAVRQLLVRERSEPALQAYGPLAAVAGRVGPADGLIGLTMTSVDVMASNVVGSADPLYLAGARLLRLVPFGPRSGAGLNLTTVSYDGTLHVGVNMDPAATPDAPVLQRCLADAFADTVIYA